MSVIIVPSIFYIGVIFVVSFFYGALISRFFSRKVTFLSGFVISLMYLASIILPNLKYQSFDNGFCIVFCDTPKWVLYWLGFIITCVPVLVGIYFGVGLSSQLKLKRKKTK